MKNILYFLSIVTILTSCAVRKKPIFVKIDQVKLVSFKRDTIRLMTQVYFKNPNDIGGKISTDKIQVIINGAEVAQVSSDEFRVPARKDFVVPLKVVIPAKRVFENNKGGILGGLLNSILNKSIKVQFKGALTYKILGFSNVYPIDKVEEIKLKI